MLKIAVPTASGRLCAHFGHCEEFTFVEVDEAEKRVINQETQVPPPHEPGVLPRWLVAQGAGVVIVGGMGAGARQLLEALGVQVVTGAAPDTPEQLAVSWLNGTLVSRENDCHGHGDGGHGHGHGHGHGCGGHCHGHGQGCGH